LCFGPTAILHAQSSIRASTSDGAVFTHMKLTVIGKAADIPIYRFMECRHYAKEHVKIAQVGISREGIPILRMVPGDYCDRPPLRQEPLPKELTQRDTNNSMKGVASWYGGRFNGQIAASGETYDMEQLTAAHRTLPFGTRVRVQRTDNGKSVEVRINDRGPFVAQRVIDLSKAAARRLGMEIPGIAPVLLAIVGAASGPSGNSSDRFAVQVAAFRIPENAHRYRDLMERAYGKARITLRHAETELWAVLVGEAPSEAKAEVLATRIIAENHEVQGAFVVRLDDLSPLAAD
jgi:rare lipoprotein A